MHGFACWCMVLLLLVAWFFRVMTMVFNLALPFYGFHGVGMFISFLSFGLPEGFHNLGQRWCCHSLLNVLSTVKRVRKSSEFWSHFPSHKISQCLITPSPLHSVWSKFSNGIWNSKNGLPDQKLDHFEVAPLKARKQRVKTKGGSSQSQSESWQSNNRVGKQTMRSVSQIGYQRVQGTYHISAVGGPWHIEYRRFTT